MSHVAGAIVGGLACAIVGCFAIPNDISGLFVVLCTGYAGGHIGYYLKFCGALLGSCLGLSSFIAVSFFTQFTGSGSKAYLSAYNLLTFLIVGGFGSFIGYMIESILFA